MSSAPTSPKRRHILSSINQETLSSKDIPTEEAEPATESNDAAPAAGENDDNDGANTSQPRPSRLKLKGEKRRHGHDDDERDNDRYRDSSHRRHHHHRRHRRRHRSPTPPNPFDEQPLDPEAAFRESLFDAMADDEGASYWQSVYGQPIHVYPSERVGPTGELEQMTDEEYAAHVRQKMWEKTHAGLIEERERREAERKKRKEEERQSRKLYEEMDRSRRRADERRQRRRWADGFEAYSLAWLSWDGTLEKLAWPVESGRRKDITEQDVREFFTCGLDVDGIGKAEFAARLKEERVRWHPDKIQQRLGGQVDSEVMKDVTLIFQTVDKLWNQVRLKRAVPEPE